jgi:SAM-dependent methyltransferase
VDAVEPGPNMIEAARKRVGAAGRVRFHLGRFEDVSLPEDAFAALFSATAFHWVDPAVGWSKAASHLEPGGLLALLTHCGLEDEGSAAADEGFRALLRKHAPDVAKDLSPSRELEEILAGVEERRANASAVWDWVMHEHHDLATDDAAGLFEDVEVATEVSTLEQTADELRDHFRTTSLYFRIDPAHRAALEEDDRRLVEGLGGTVRFSLAAVLMTARRR